MKMTDEHTDDNHMADWVPEMARSQQEWQLTVDAITDYIFVVDMDRRIKRSNKSFSGRFNLHPREVTGMKVDELFLSGFQDVTRVLDEAFRIRNSVVAEATVGPGIFMISIFPVVLGRDESFVCVMKDVTEMKAMRDRLSHSYKLASIGQLVSGVAHEINNPLTGILGFSELLSMRVKDESVLKDIEKIQKAAERCRMIVESLLCFSRQQKPHRRQADINDILDKTIELRSYWHKSKDIEVVRDYRDLPMAFVDAQQIQHAVLNVLMNAEHAVLSAGGKGRITIGTFHDPEAGKIIVRVTDNGCGIPEHVRGKIFDPFFTTKQVGEGSGLGLSMTYGIISGHGGSIRVDSTEGEGTTFTMEFPLKKPGIEDIEV